MKCIHCEGKGSVDQSVRVGPRHSPTPNDWDVVKVDCASCLGTGQVDDIICARCQRHAPADQAVAGADLDGALLGFWFCPECADQMAAPPAFPKEAA
jgi:hypothetical protein